MVVLPSQKLVLPVMVGDKLVFSDTLVLAVPIQPKLSVTLSCRLAIGSSTKIVCVASPVDQVYCA